MKDEGMAESLNNDQFRNGGAKEANLIGCNQCKCARVFRW